MRLRVCVHVEITLLDVIDLLLSKSRPLSRISLFQYAMDTSFSLETILKFMKADVRIRKPRNIFYQL